MNEKVVEVSEMVCPPQSSIKLSKNSKGYTWEIKVYCDDLDKALIEVEKQNKMMLFKYGSEPDVQ